MKTYNPIKTDTKLGNYYVSVIDGDRSIFLLGPFDDHSHAQAMVEACRKKIGELYASDPKLPFYGFGTCRTEPGGYAKPGVLNAHFNR